MLAEATLRYSHLRSLVVLLPLTVVYVRGPLCWLPSLVDNTSWCVPGSCCWLLLSLLSFPSLPLLLFFFFFWCSFPSPTSLYML